VAASALALPASAPAATFPAASTGPATQVSYASAALTGLVNPRGQDTNYYFQYGTSRAYGALTPLTPAGAGRSNIPVSEPVGGLAPVTTYHFRLVAVGSSGTARGADRTFRTSAVPLSLQIAGTPNPVLFGNPFAVVGNLAGTNNGGREVVLQVLTPTGYTNVANPELTTASGGFSFAFTNSQATATLRVITTTRPVVSSPALVEQVQVRVSLHLRHTRRRNRVRFFGTVSPQQAGAGVDIQKLKPRHGFVTVASSTVGKHSRFSRKVRLHGRGLYRAYVRATDGYAPNVSTSVLIR